MLRDVGITIGQFDASEWNPAEKEPAPGTSGRAEALRKAQEEFGQELREKTKPLVQHLELGRTAPGLPDYVRELVANRNYIIFYRVLPEGPHRGDFAKIMVSDPIFCALIKYICWGSIWIMNHQRQLHAKSPVTDKFEREFTEVDLRASSSRQDECRANMVRRGT